MKSLPPPTNNWLFSVGVILIFGLVILTMILLLVSFHIWDLLWQELRALHHVWQFDQLKIVPDPTHRFFMSRPPTIVTVPMVVLTLLCIWQQNTGQLRLLLVLLWKQL